MSVPPLDDVPRPVTEGQRNSRTLLTRTRRHRAAAAALEALDDRELGNRLDAATPLGVGIGGRTARMDVEGVPVFAKRIPLTDLERRPENTGSTANLFGLPTSYQYGVGSTGFGAWRELAAHTTTTGWVLDGGAPNFPLLYHWRILPSPPSPPPYVGDWDGDAAVARRIEAIAAATAGVVLFLEYVPQTLHEWLSERFEAGDGERAAALADRELHATADVLRTRGMVHFDAHPNNVLTDGDRLYVSDFGLALDTSFRLSPAEAEFLDRHRYWDRYDAERYLVNWVRRRLGPEGTLPPYAAALAARYGPTVALMNDFYDRLVAGPKTSPYPAEALRRADRARATSRVR